MKYLTQLQSQEGQQPFPSDLQQPRQKKCSFFSISAITLLLIIATFINYSLEPDHPPMVTGIRQQIDSFQRQQEKQIEKREDGKRTKILFTNKTKNRISYGQPHSHSNKARALVLQKKGYQNMQKQKACVITNGINGISKLTVDTGRNFLQNQNVFRWIIYLPAVDNIADQLLREDANSPLITIESTSLLQINSNYDFVNPFVKSCDFVIYLQNNFVISKESVGQIIKSGKSTKKNLNYGFVVYSDRLLIGQVEQKLKNLNNSNLESIKEEQINKYLFIFDTNFLHFITPLNYANYNKYTFEQILIFPILTLTQKSKYLSAISEQYHSIDQVYASLKEFYLKQLPGKLNQPCFVTFPSNFNENNLGHVEQYIKNFQQLSLTSSIETTLIIYLSYNFEVEETLFLIYSAIRKLRQQSSKINVKIRISYKISLPSIASYQSAHSFCSTNSIILLSRADIKIDANLDHIGSQIEQNVHFYAQTNKEPYTKQESQKNRFSVNQFKARFYKTQIVKGKLLRMLYLWALKRTQTQFFQTEASYVIPLLQIVNYRFKQLPLTSEIVQVRQINQVEISDIEMIQQFEKWPQIQNNNISPIPYNSLLNEDLRKGSLPKIPKIVHRIWFSPQDMPNQVELRARKKVQGEDYQYILWKRQNFTANNFPLSFDIVSRILQSQQQNNKSYHFFIEPILSFEILYNYGGFFVANNIQLDRSLEQLRKYSLLFSNFKSEIGSQSPVSVGREVIGCKKHCYHMKLLLSQLITFEEVDYNFEENLEYLYGGDIIRVSMTNKELFLNVGFLFNSLINERVEMNCKKQGKCRANDFTFYGRIHSF